MVELIDNVVQLTVAALGTLLTGLMTIKNRKQEYFILTCFYGTFTFGSLYWVIYLLLTDYTPKIFYVSDLSWVASLVFLLTLDLYIAAPEERRLRHGAMWLAPVLGIGLMLFYFHWGDYLVTFMLNAATTAVSWFSIRGLIFARRQSGEARNKQYLHMAILFYVFMEYCLWTSSCFWVSNTLTNPYFWFDFALTASLILLLPAMRKAVAP